MIVTVGQTVQGHNIQKYLGLTCGVSMRNNDVSKKGIVDQLKGLADKVGLYGQICKEAREQAYQAMAKHAESLGANAVIGVSFDSAKFSDDTPYVEVCCYGTAVVIVPMQPAAKPAIQSPAK